MLKRNNLISIIENYFGTQLLQDARARDAMANGIQILGKEEVNHITIAVSATMDLFKEAKKRNTDFILTKHPLFISAPDQIFDPSLQRRLKTIFENNWTVGGYHNVLDIHPEVGNASILVKKLNMKSPQLFYGGWGYAGELAEPQTIESLGDRLEELMQHNIFVVRPETVRPIKRIGVVSGGGIPKSEQLMEMLSLKLDAYITGEISEWTVHLFRESDIAYFACGHHATEVFGPQAFAAKLQELVGDKAKVEFINIWNEI